MRKNYIFKDVDDTLDNTAIRFVARNGIMDGYADGSFQPDETVTLAELCQIICNCIFDKYDDLEEEYRSTDENLKEKFGNHWANKYLTICYKKQFLPDSISSDEVLDRKTGESILFKLEEYWVNLFEFKGYIRHSYEKIIRSHKLSRGEVAYFLYTRISDIARFLDNKLYDLRINEKFDEAANFIIQLPKTFVDRLTLNRDLSLIRYHVRHTTKENIPYLLKIANILLRRLDRNDVLYHYTSLRALEHMTKDGANIIFKASNSVYLNDPLEGKILMRQLQAKRDRLFSPLKTLQKQNRVRYGSEIIFSDTYILSFFKAEDGDVEKLPMWVHYGDGGNGCLIEFDTQDCNLPFYKVMYQEKEIRQVWKELKDALVPVDRDFEKTDSNYNQIYKYAYVILDQLSWLCKSLCYSDEKEVRLLFFEQPEDACEETFIRDGEAFPRIYVPCPEPLEISKVILGPKIMHPERYSLTLNHRDIDLVFVSQLPFQ